MIKPFVKIVNPCFIEISGRKREVFVEITYAESGELTLHGVIGPWHSGNCAGSCGQIVDELQNINRYHRHWSRKRVQALRRVWNDWHLNHMRAGCIHQDGWDTAKELAMPDGKKVLAGWVRPEEHPAGLLCKPCPVCGYKYGSGWTKRTVPQEVLEFLLCDLPAAEKKPAWV